MARIEKLNSNLESQFENDRLEYEKTIAALEEQSEKREQKYSVRSSVTFVSHESIGGETVVLDSRIYKTYNKNVAFANGR